MITVTTFGPAGTTLRESPPDWSAGPDTGCCGWPVLTDSAGNDHCFCACCDGCQQLLDHCPYDDSEDE